MAGAFGAGSEAIVRYGTTPPEDHVRLILCHVHARDYVVLTPDLDMYVESLEVDGRDVLAL